MISFAEVNEATTNAIEADRIEAAEREAKISNEISIFIEDIREQLLPSYTTGVDNAIIGAAQRGRYQVSVGTLRNYKRIVFEKFITDNGIFLNKKRLDSFESRIEEFEDEFFFSYAKEGFKVEKKLGNSPLGRTYKISWKVKEEPKEEPAEMRVNNESLSNDC